MSSPGIDGAVVAAIRSGASDISEQLDGLRSDVDGMEADARAVAGALAFLDSLRGVVWAAASLHDRMDDMERALSTIEDACALAAREPGSERTAGNVVRAARGA